ncbi:MAG: hypothetical protein ACTSUE_16740 [Promethearchaeota archaeon]
MRDDDYNKDDDPPILPMFLVKTQQPPQQPQYVIDMSQSQEGPITTRPAYDMPQSQEGPTTTRSAYDMPIEGGGGGGGEVFHEVPLHRKEGIGRITFKGLTLTQRSFIFMLGIGAAIFTLQAFILQRGSEGSTIILINAVVAFLLTVLLFVFFCVELSLFCTRSKDNQNTFLLLFLFVIILGFTVIQTLNVSIMVYRQASENFFELFLSLSALDQIILITSTLTALFMVIFPWIIIPAYYKKTSYEYRRISVVEEQE